MTDPVTLGLSIAGGSLLSTLMGSAMAGDAPTPTAPPPKAPPAASPTGSPSDNKPKGIQSFMSSAAPPSPQRTGGATLLGS